MTLVLAGPAVIGVAGCALGLLVGTYAVIAPRGERLPLNRRRPDAPAPGSALSGATAATTSLLDRVLRRRGLTSAWSAALELAGLKLRVQDFALLLIVSVLVAAAVGATLSGPLLAFALALAVPVLAKVMVGVLTKRRQRAFADQLDDSLQLMSSSLRAGHSILQALASVAREAEQPTSEEFGRILNESRVGRPLGDSLHEAAERMGSNDFIWITQAIAINREVGGNLAEVLDGVGHTIRERNQIRRQVKALAAEGKLSAIVLMVLPFGIGGFLMISNPEYMLKFTQSVLGYGLILISVILLVVGGLWLRKSVRVVF